MADEEHFLASGKAGAGYGLAGVFGIGIALMFTPTLPFWVGCMIAFVSASGTAWVGFNDIKKRTRVGFLLAAFATVEFIVTAFLVVQTSMPFLISRIFLGHQNSQNISHPLDYKILFSWETMVAPSSFPGDQFYWVYELGPPPTYYANPPNAGRYMLIQAGLNLVWGLDPLSVAFAKCTISNYSDVSLLGVSIALQTRFFPLKKTETGYVSNGNPITGRYLITPPLNLAPAASPNNSQDFFVTNRTDFAVGFDPAEEAQFTVAGTIGRQTAKLIPSNQPNLNLWPGILPTNPPAAPPEAPKPQ